MSVAGAVETLRTWAQEARRLDRASFVHAHRSPLLVLLDPAFGDGSAPRSQRVDALALPPDAPVFSVAKRPGGNPHPGMVTIGRAVNNDVVVPSHAVSNFHAWLAADARGAWSIRDGRSSGGTTVGGQRVEPSGHPLGDDALVGLGEVRCRFMTTGAFHTIARAAGW